jgi:TRAP-type C4-dicarboxylate transport system permease small subunit
MGGIAFCVIFSVIARYFFGKSFTFLEEFITTLFAFTTFWGMGICVLENEHVVVDTVFHMFPPLAKKILSIVDYSIVLAIDIVMIRYGWAYATRYGSQISMGMRVPMIWMYGLIPLSSAIALVCIVIKLVEIIRKPVALYATVKPVAEAASE